MNLPASHYMCLPLLLARCSPPTVSIKHGIKSIQTGRALGASVASQACWIRHHKQPLNQMNQPVSIILGRTNQPNPTCIAFEHEHEQQFGTQARTARDPRHSIVHPSLTPTPVHHVKQPGAGQGTNPVQQYHFVQQFSSTSSQLPCSCTARGLAAVRYSLGAPGAGVGGVKNVLRNRLNLLLLQGVLPGGHGALAVGHLSRRQYMSSSTSVCMSCNRNREQ